MENMGSRGRKMTQSMYNYYVTQVLHKLRDELIDKIKYEEDNADTDKVKYHDGAHNGYVNGLYDSTEVILDYIKQEIAKI
jgi:Fe-S oxidoreductase